MKTKTPKETTVTTIDENVRVIDNPEEEEEQRKRAERKLRVRVADKKERFKLLPTFSKSSTLSILLFLLLLLQVR